MGSGLQVGASEKERVETKWAVISRSARRVTVGRFWLRVSLPCFGGNINQLLRDTTGSSPIPQVRLEPAIFSLRGTSHFLHSASGAQLPHTPVPPCCLRWVWGRFGASFHPTPTPAAAGGPRGLRGGLIHPTHPHLALALLSCAGRCGRWRRWGVQSGVVSEIPNGAPHPHPEQPHTRLASRELSEAPK